MKSLLVAFPLLFAAGALTAQTRPARLVANPVFEATGNSPVWRLAIGDRIALRLGPDADGFVTLRYFPRARARTTDGVRRWESRTTDGAVITIEAREAPCTVGDTQYRDSVTVTHGAQRLTGCGGRRLSGG